MAAAVGTQTKSENEKWLLPRPQAKTGTLKQKMPNWDFHIGLHDNASLCRVTCVSRATSASCRLSSASSRDSRRTLSSSDFAAAALAARVSLRVKRLARVLIKLWDEQPGGRSYMHLRLRTYRVFTKQVTSR